MRWPIGAALALVLSVPGSSVSAGPSISELVELADISSLSVSPSGRYLVFRVERALIDKNSYLLDWYAADLRSGEVRHLGGGGAPVEGPAEPLAVETTVWSPDERHVFHRALVDGVIGLWRTAVDGSGSRPVVVADADVEQVTANADGRSLAYVLGPSRFEIEEAERREYDDGILVDGSVDLLRNLHSGAWVNGRIATSRLVGRWTSSAGLLWREPRRRYRLELVSLTVSGPERVDRQQLTPGPGADDVAAAALEAPGRPPVRVRRENGHFLIEVVRDGEAVACPGVVCRAGRLPVIAWRPASGELAITARDGHYRQTLYLWDVERGRVRHVVSAKGLLSGSRLASRPCALSHEAAYCVTASAAEPPRLERIDLSTGARTVLFDPNALLRRLPRPRVEQLSWTLDDGREATGTVLLPEGGANRAPLFVSYYECPGYLRGTAGDEFPLAPLVDAGFVAACLNTVAAESNDIADVYQTGLEAVDALVRLLAARGLVDPARVGMGGFSFGSEVTMWTAMNSDLLAAVSVASPQYTPARYWLSALPGRDYAEVLREAIGLGSPDETPERWRRVSPALNAERIAAPLLMQLPENEARAEAEVFARLARTPTPVELYAFPEERHAKFQPRHRLAVYRRNLDWFRYWLQDHVDPDPAKAGQYARWQAMRQRRDGAQGSSPRSQVSAAAMSSSRR
ncbi:MAG TPA: Atxe2 family lasso peptide isopeptidase [Geminicoccaceae bacterium]|jgi:dienelactone hydrolase|nr:Atxe2 family lasso peptide isopeptidase [Geminicoccaceae bacterium]